MSENLIGATTAVFPIRLSVAVASPVDVEWATRDGSAVAGLDYKAAAGTVTFLPGETEKQIEVQVYGQAITPADDKVFFIRLNPPSNAVLVDAILTCTINIIDDQGTPSVAVVVAEGRHGPKGDPGLSAYEQAVLMGYTGTLTEWMDHIADASKAADRAGDHAVSAAEDALKAQNAAKKAVFAGVVFPTTAEGVDPVLGVQNGAYFNVRSPLSEHYIDEYQNINGVAVATGKSYPTSDHFQNISEHTALPFVDSTSYKLNQRVVLANGDIVKSTIDGNTNDPNVDMTGWELPQARDVFDESGLSQQEINDKRKKNPFDFGAVGDGIANDIETIRATINARGEITSGIFYCELNSDDDTLVIPDGFVLNCSSDSKFIYDFWGSPLFALIGNNGSGIKGHNIEYRGVYDASIGLTTRTFKSYSRAIVRHRYCADIVVLGGNNNSIIGTHSGTNPQNIGVLFEPNADGSLAKNNTADISANYRCQSIVSSGQIGFDFKVNQGVLATNSQALYGPAHAIYDVQEVISKDGKYTIIDTGEYSDSVNMTETHTLSLKYAESVVAEINSSRSAGPLNFAGCTGCTFNLTSVYDGIVATASVGHIFYTSINGRVEPSDGNTINANILLTGAAHNGRIYDSSFGASVAPITGTVANISFLRTVDGTHGHALKIGDTGGVFNITSTQKGDTNRPIIEFSGGNSNTANINVIEGGSRIVYASGVGNVVNLKGNIPTVQSNIPTAGNTSNVVMPSYKNRLTTSQVTNPSFSIQLPPKFGVYLVSLKLATAGSNHARSGVWLVNHDDTSTFDFASCQLIGVQITKGAGDSIPTSLDLTVNSTGLLSVASASKLNFYILDYGFLAIA